ncbi:MAG: O-methyltransferase [Fusobacteria bacterium]|nr:MAG: O-methyltransferase [Fusobacteriota bacterium]
MIDNIEKANKYVISKIIEKDSIILEMEDYAKEHNVPIVTKEVAEYLKFMIDSHKITNILEVGTAIGYSGSVMLQGNDKVKLTTLEIDEKRHNLAKINFEKMGFSSRVTQILGDALEEIPKLEDQFDFIFIDASKGKYMNFYKDSYKLLKKDGIIFIDNIMFRGYLYNEYPKRFKTIVRKLNEFIEYLYENENFVLLPFGDGIGLVKK